MPSVMIYIRQTDYDKWLAVQDKPTFIHDALNSEPAVVKKNLVVGEVISGAPDPDLGFPCCQKKVPCKHWSFDGEMGTWTNTITGATREVTA